MNKTVITGKVLEMNEERIVLLQEQGVDVFNRRYYCLLTELMDETDVIYKEYY